MLPPGGQGCLSGAPESKGVLAIRKTDNPIRLRISRGAQPLTVSVNGDEEMGKLAASSLEKRTCTPAVAAPWRVGPRSNLAGVTTQERKSCWFVAAKPAKNPVAPYMLQRLGGIPYMPKGAQVPGTLAPPPEKVATVPREAAEGIPATVQLPPLAHQPPQSSGWNWLPG